MLVKTLIKELQKMNPEAEVRVGDYHGSVALFVLARLNDDKIVWIESEEDVDMETELEARYENAIEEQMDELDFYMDLLEIGITVDMVREYMDDEHADHMKKFCEEHGLIQEGNNNE